MHLRSGAWRPGFFRTAHQPGTCQPVLFDSAKAPNQSKMTDLYFGNPVKFEARGLKTCETLEFWKDGYSPRATMELWVGCIRRIPHNPNCGKWELILCANGIWIDWICVYIYICIVLQYIHIVFDTHITNTGCTSDASKLKLISEICRILNAKKSSHFKCLVLWQSRTDSWENARYGIGIVSPWASQQKSCFQIDLSVRSRCEKVSWENLVVFWGSNLGP